MCLYRAQMVTGKQSVTRSSAWRNLAGLIAICRVVVAVRLENEMQSVSRCTDPNFGPGLWDCGSSIQKKSKHNPFLQSLVRILTIDVPIV